MPVGIDPVYSPVLGIFFGILQTLAQFRHIYENCFIFAGSSFRSHEPTFGCFRSRLLRGRLLKFRIRPRRPASRRQKPPRWSTHSRRVPHYALPPPSMPQLRPPTPPAVACVGAAPTPSTTAMKRKQQGNHLVQGGAADATPSSFSPASVPHVKAAGGRKNTSSTGPAGARAKPPEEGGDCSKGSGSSLPLAGHDLPIHGDSTGHAYHVFNETSGRYKFFVLLDLLW